MQIQPVGDSALRVVLGETIDQHTLDRVREACLVLTDASIPAIVELVPAYTTVTVYYDAAIAVGAGAPIDGVVAWMTHAVRAAIEGAAHTSAASARAFEIPVCYGGECGADLEAVAAHTGLSVAEVVASHTRARYRVAMIGFAPGFPYLVGLPQSLAVPRLATPRVRVPAGSVGIAGEQTGVYPLETPGGWRLIGRTPVALFRPDLDPPTLLQPGDEVTFRSITGAEFASLASQDTTGTRDDR